MTDKRRQEIHCHACNRYVQFEIDLSLDGNHVLKCPNCEHEHCRVVKNGEITGDRWDSRNGLSSFTVTTVSSSTTSIYDNMGGINNGSSAFVQDLWLGTASTGSSIYTVYSTIGSS